jgi:hypothetical protein
MKLTTVGIDLAKNVFQAHGIDEHGKVAKYAHPLEKVKRADFPSEGGAVFSQKGVPSQYCSVRRFLVSATPVVMALVQPTRWSSQWLDEVFVHVGDLQTLCLYV